MTDQGGTATRVVVLDGRPDAGATVAAVLGRGGFEAASSDDPARTTDAVRLEGVGVLVVAGAAGGVRSASDVVTYVRRHQDPAVREVSLVALVDDGTGADAALVAGADSVLLRPVEGDRLVEAVGDVARLDAATRTARRRRR